MPSEFKADWDALVTQYLLDAFPDFLDNYAELVQLVQEFFLVICEEISVKKTNFVESVAACLNIKRDGAKEHLSKRMDIIF